MIESLFDKFNITIPVGMTTCPRDEPYIQESINSLVNNGWGVPLVYNDLKMRGDWWGFVKLLQLLVSAYPEHDQFIIVQDDIVATKTPEETFAVNDFHWSSGCVVSLYTGSEEIKKRKEYSPCSMFIMNIFTLKDRVKSCNGGIAYLIPKDVAEVILNRPYTKWTPTTLMLGELCHENNFHYAILAENAFEHIGERSSLQPPDYKWDVTKAEPYRKRDSQ